MAAGNPFTVRQQRRVAETLERASRETGLDFTVYIGDVNGDPRNAAERLHAALGTRAPQAVLLLVAPGQRRLEIVTGVIAGRRIPDRACGLASLSMSSAFTGGDLVGGVVSGVRMLADTAGQVP